MMTRIVGWGYAALLLLLFVYATIAAVGNFIGVTGALGDLIGGLGYVLLILGIALPALGLAVALWLGWKRTGGQRLLLLSAALCAVAALQLELQHLVTPRLDQLIVL